MSSSAGQSGADGNSADRESPPLPLCFKVKQCMLVFLLGFSILDHILGIIKLDDIADSAILILSGGKANEIRVNIEKPLMETILLVAFILSICLDLIFIFGIVTQNCCLSAVFSLVMVATAGCKSIGALMAINGLIGAIEAIFTALWAVAFLADLRGMRKNEQYSV